eukprot:scaffold41315_cov20-Tisochrysis_lutea.AAC.2
MSKQAKSNRHHKFGTGVPLTPELVKHCVCCLSTCVCVCVNVCAHMRVCSHLLAWSSLAKYTIQKSAQHTVPRKQKMYAEPEISFHLPVHFGSEND